MSAVDLSTETNLIESSERVRTKQLISKHSIGLLVTAIIFYFPSMLLTMAADAPQSVGSLMLMLSGLSFSPMCLIAIVFSWIAYALKRYKAAVMLLGLPFINIIFMFLSGLFWDLLI